MTVKDIRDLEREKFDADGAVKAVLSGGLDVPVGSDYLTVAYPNSSSETYTYKKGGAAGETLKTVTVVYTDATKAKILEVSWI